MKYLFDTDCLIDAIVGRPQARERVRLLSDDGVAVSIITVAETYDGAFGTQDPARTLAGFRAFLADFAVLPVTDAVAATSPRCAFCSGSKVNSFPIWIS